MKRGKRRWWKVALIGVVVAVAVTAGALLLGSSKAQAVRYLTAKAGTGTIAKTVQADFTLRNARDSMTIALGGSTSSSSSSSASSASSTSSSSTTSDTSTASTAGTTSSTSSSSVVTGIALAAGATPHTLEHLLTVSGEPVYAFVSSKPLYETLSTSLSSGTDKVNVAELQRALKAAGYYTGTVNGDFGSTTATALEDWQAAKGLTETGTVTTSQFVWVPRGAVISSWNVSLGGNASSGTPLATVTFPRPLVATAPVSQADISSLKVGQKATLTVTSATSVSFTGTVAKIDTEPASSSSSTNSSSSTVDYTVTFRLGSVPTAVKSGMTGSLTVTIAKRSNVLVVPTSALTGSSYVRVMVHGKPVYRQVSTGMATSSLTQILSGLAAGEVVMTGTYSPSATASATSNTSNSVIQGLTGGAAAGGGPLGGGAPPSGGGQ
jgi:HlyD family secretion protein/Putative peptidoglycan binding domain